MPDVSMCQDISCPSSPHCYRFKAKPKPKWQSYVDFQRQGRVNCDSFWPVEKEEEEAAS